MRGIGVGRQKVEIRNIPVIEAEVIPSVPGGIEAGGIVRIAAPVVGANVDAVEPAAGGTLNGQIDAEQARA